MKGVFGDCQFTCFPDCQLALPPDSAKNLIFVTACWESYIEDLAVEAFDFLLAHAPTAAAIPNKVKSLAIKDIKNDPNPLKLWDLADTGWQAILLAHKTEVHEKWLGKFNTPKSAASRCPLRGDVGPQQPEQLLEMEQDEGRPSQDQAGRFHYCSRQHCSPYP
uniref:Uncharacterized protein n=1 Tax=Pseudomonas aeruginosa TaxID=287 RepID=A0A7S6C7J4_PSEAI|nr:hypothetical protein [Pseudomonas aeruginosa]